MYENNNHMKEYKRYRLKNPVGNKFPVIFRQICYQLMKSCKNPRQTSSFVAIDDTEIKNYNNLITTRKMWEEIIYVILSLSLSIKKYNYKKEMELEG